MSPHHRFFCVAAVSLIANIAQAQTVEPTPQDPTPPQAQPTPDRSLDPRVPPDRPKYFGLYPPPPPGKITPTRPPASTATRRPSLFDPISVYPKRDTLLFDGAIDGRYQKTNADTTGSYVAAVRFTLDYIRANPKDGDERGGARVQLVAEPSTARNTSLNKLRASEMYAFYRFQLPGVSATVKGGQIVLPFGLAAIYDTPMQPIQPLYSQSIGLRVDTGVALEGVYGPYRYLASVTTGSGPNKSDSDGNKVVAFRLERNFLTQSGNIQFGASMLTGRTPVTTRDTQLPVSGTSNASQFIDKTRFGLDVQYTLGSLVARGEAVFGADDQNPVFGYFGEANYGFKKRLTAVAFLKQWNFPIRPESVFVIGGGLNLDLGYGITLRTLYEYERTVPINGAGSPISDRKFTIQTRLNF